MTPQPASGAAVNTLIRITVTCNERRLDVGVPSQTPLAELLPEFARSLGVLDPLLVYGGYSLVNAAGTTLDPAAGLASQGAGNGELYTLNCGATQAEPKVYDDIVEAVADTVERQHKPWTAQNSSYTALATSAALLVVGAALLLGAPQSSQLTSLIAGCAALLLITVGSVLGRVKQEVAGLVLILIASVFGAVAGYTAVAGENLFGWPLAALGGGAALTSFIGVLVIPTNKEVALVPGISGLVIAVAASVTALFDFAPSGVFALTLALAATLGNGLPWLAMSTSKLQIITPQNDQEIFADPQPIDPANITAQFERGQRVLLATRAALGVVTVIAAPIVVGSGVIGAILCALCFVGMMLKAREVYAKADVLTIMSTSVIGLVVTGVSAVVLHPDWRESLVLAFGLVAAVIVSLTLLPTKPRMAVGRIADAVDLIALALLLPLGVTVAGIA
ncbi:type VII secretion integral membrane protein EccD [Lysinibacter cavernae]|uniref:Type VII secretion integral membrane protein EccD n=1 Tax=Lysinibacter cavernae TaxID=1640652 RepID=A0A7X5TTX7_9MICO|nr:type VII secretion integral membrane protein EccD [Lysinibacter cavernae]NIH53994.1 type VII secretion integral membrane protein EccD [Lysinibacter cavernae]